MEQEGNKEKKVVSLKLFGVHIFGGEREEFEEVMRKSSSMPNLVSFDGRDGQDDGYDSDGALDGSPSRKSRRRKSQERKKGIPWSEEEHRTFLAGLRQLGKGDWRGISKNFVTTRTPTQVASHAQKYFLRQSNPGKKKRRASLFDVAITDQLAPIPETVPALSVSNSSKVAIQEIHHTDRGEGLVPNYINTGNFKSDSMKVDEAIDDVKKKAITTLPLALPTRDNDLELSIAPPRGAIGAIKVL